MSKEKSEYSWIKKFILISIGILVISGAMFFMINDKEVDNEFIVGSNIKVENLNQNQTENIKKLCKVWGLAKYYHPVVVAGDINWDYELFRVMPEILDA